MADNSERQARRISLRVSTVELAMIDRAAALRGLSRTDFVLDAAMRAAEEASPQQNLIHMSPERFSEFVGILSRPGQAIPRLGELLRRPPPWKEERDGPE